MPAMARRITNAGKGDQQNEDAVELFCIGNGVIEDEPADDIGDGVDRHGNHAKCHDDFFKLGNRPVN